MACKNHIGVESKPILLRTLERIVFSGKLLYRATRAKMNNGAKSMSDEIPFTPPTMHLADMVKIAIRRNIIAGN